MISDCNLQLKIASRWAANGTHKGDFRDIAPTGKKINITGITIAKIINGKIVETWGATDNLGMMQQIGAISIPGQK